MLFASFIFIFRRTCEFIFVIGTIRICFVVTEAVDVEPMTLTMLAVITVFLRVVRVLSVTVPVAITNRLSGLTYTVLLVFKFDKWTVWTADFTSFTYQEFDYFHIMFRFLLAFIVIT